MIDNSNDWHKKQKYPPQGLLVEGLILSASTGRKWACGSVVCEITSEYAERARVFKDEVNGDNYIILSPMHFRPIKSKRDKAIEAALNQDCPPNEGMLSRRDFCGKLYDAGLLRLPD